MIGKHKRKLPGKEFWVSLKEIVRGYEGLLDLVAERPEIWEALKMKWLNPQMSVGQIAEKTGLSPDTVKRHLRETLKACPKLSEVLECDPRELLD